MCAVVLFLLPSRTEPGHKIMDWESTATLPWYPRAPSAERSTKIRKLTARVRAHRGIVMLMGGGFALAKGFVSSGLSEFLGEELEVLESLPVAVLLLVICSSLTFLTELTSNVAVCLPHCSLLAFGFEQTLKSPPIDGQRGAAHPGFDCGGHQAVAPAPHDPGHD